MAQAKKTVTVIPAYGRDYKSAAAVRADYEADKDFIVMDPFSGNDRRAVNKQDAEREGIQLRVRYQKLTKVVIL